MNKGLVAVIVVGLVIAGIGGAWWAYTRGFEEGRAKGREEGTYYARQMPADTGTVSRSGGRLHFGAAHAEHDLGSDALAGVAESLLKQGGGLVELHDARFGLRNAIHDSLQLTTLTGPAGDFVVQDIANVSTSMVNGRPRVTIAGRAGDSVALDFSDTSQVTMLQGKINNLFLVMPPGSQQARLDFIVTTGQAPAPAHRWAMVTLTMLQDSAPSDDCMDHCPACPEVATLTPAR